jgi:division/cell wall cluster transcriptional repressor MraZ
VNRKTQVVVATVIWVVCLVGIATAVRMKGGLPHLSFPESAEAIAAETSQEPAADSPAAAEPSPSMLNEVEPTEPAQVPALPDDAPETIKNRAVFFSGFVESNAPLPAQNDAPRLPEKTKQTAMTLWPPPPQTLKDLHSTPEKAEETAVTPPIVPPPSALPPAPPPPAATVKESGTSAVPPAEPPSKVALDVPSADLLPPVRPNSPEPPMVTPEPPTLERASAKPPVREDNSSPGVPMQALPPRPLSEVSLALCLWSAVGKTKPRAHRAAKHEEPFVGTYFCTLDSQKGLVLPQKASEQMGLPRRVYLTPGPDDCLWLCNAAALERLTDKLDEDARRLYYAQTVRVAIDASGRITLPETLGPVGCLRQDLVLLGAGDHFELWDAQRLQRYVDQKAGKRAAKMEK